MAFTIAPSADQQTLSSKFFDCAINGTIKGLVTQVQSTYNDRGDFVQCVGEDSPRNNPDTRWGSATIDSLVLPQNDITDILVSSQVFGAGAAATADADLRFPQLTIAVMYNDTAKKYTKTYTGCYIRSRELTISGNRLAVDRIQFDYLREALSYS